MLIHPASAVRLLRSLDTAQVESLAAARQAAISGSEPADAVRAVNALLTGLDSLSKFPNVMVLTTSNLTTAIDIAFVDRADIKAYLGPPDLQVNIANPAWKATKPR